jgi:hypothetical protein
MQLNWVFPIILGSVLAAAMAAFAGGGSARAATDPWQMCADAIAGHRSGDDVPKDLLAAIAVTESGRKHPDHPARVAWPWTVNAEGRGRHFATKAEAIAWVRDLQRRDVNSIDVGCMQVNLRYHPDAFASLEEAFDPRSNVAYAASFLAQLQEETGSWMMAAGRYHSATPALSAPYRMKVASARNDQQRANLADRRLAAWRDEKISEGRRRVARHVPEAEPALAGEATPEAASEGSPEATGSVSPPPVPSRAPLAIPIERRFAALNRTASRPLLIGGMPSRLAAGQRTLSAATRIRIHSPH